MAETSISTTIIAFRDLTDRLDIVLQRDGNYIIGLSASGSIIIEQDDTNLCMSLLYLTLHYNGGCTLSLATNDLPCYLNHSKSPLSGEVHLIDGSTIEMADKKLKFFDGPIPKRRRKLPRTPGTLVDDPPRKPDRRQVREGTSPGNTDITVDNRNLVDTGDNGDTENTLIEADKRWLEASWCMLDLPQSDQYMFKDLYTPEQISILAASYFTKQLRMFTDAIITQDFLDSIFQMFMDTIADNRDTYMDYLAEISRALTKIPDRSNTRPMHGPAVRFLTELLKQCLEPVERVVLLLDLLRTFSHFDSNIDKMIRYQTSAAVLGSMSVYLHNVQVQRYSMDILAKLATFKPTLEIKTPIREVAADMIFRAVQYHPTDLPLARSACRVLANLSSTLIAVLNHTIEAVSPTTDSEMCGFINKYEELLSYIFIDGIPLVQSMMKTFVNDIGVNTEGRRFIFYYVKLPQMQIKKEKWMAEAVQMLETTQNTTHTEEDVNTCDNVEAMDTEPESSNIHNDPECEVQHIDDSNHISEGNMDNHIIDNVDEISNTNENIDNLSHSNDTMDEDSHSNEDKINGTTSPNENNISGVGGNAHSNSYEDTDDNSCSDEGSNVMYSRTDSREFSKPLGILKKIGSYENLRTPERRLGFKDGTVGGSASDSEEFTSVSDAECDGSLIFSLPKRTDNNDNFNSNVVKHLVRKTIKRRRTAHGEDIDDSESESEHEFLTSLDKLSSSSEYDGDIETSGKDVKAGEVPVRKYDYNDLKPPSEQNVIPEDINSVDSEQTGNVSDIIEKDDPEISNSGTYKVTAGDTGTTSGRQITRDMEHSAITDVVFLGKLVRTQIIAYVGSLVFKGEDSKVLMVIDKSIKTLLEDAAAPIGLIQYAGNQYGANLTLMDLEPAIVISVIDAVRYRSVTTELVQSAVLSLTRSMCATLQKETINTTMLFFKSIFSDPNLSNIITDKDFLKEFRTCFQNATDRMEKSHTIEEIRNNLGSHSFVV